MNSENSERYFPGNRKDNREIRLWDVNADITSNENLIARDVTRVNDTRKISKRTIYYIISITLLCILVIGLCIDIPIDLHQLKSSPERHNSRESSKDLNTNEVKNETLPDVNSRLWETNNNTTPDINPTSRIDLEVESHCKPILNNVSKPYSISQQKCMEYQERYVYPCRESSTPNEGMIRMNDCNWKPEPLIIDGNNASFGEFPHMALLGFDTADEHEEKWRCGGVLVSEKFVLTAAHCTTLSIEARGSGRIRKGVKYVKIGILLRSETETPTNTYTVKRIHRPIDRHPVRPGHDIALLETNRVMKLNRYAFPACLYDGSPIDDSLVIATGWGTTKIKETSLPDCLQKVTLEKYLDEYCSNRYQNLVRKKYGFDKEFQVCYGDKHSSRDTCSGDSGGPTQIRHPQVKCMYLITAIISNGKWCGDSITPGLYTRVAAYRDWIESVVWPDLYKLHYNNI